MKFPDSHEEFFELTDAYVDGELDPATEDAYLKHIRECAVCRERLDERLELLGRVSPEKEPPADLHGRIISAVKAENAGVAKKTVGKKGFRRFAAVAAIAAVLVLMTVIVLAVLPGKTGSGEAPEPSVPESTNERGGNADGLSEEISENMEKDSAPDVTIALTSQSSVPDDPTENANANAYVASREPLDSAKVNRGLLILSGVLAVAAFIAFLISLSSVSASLPTVTSEENAAGNAESKEKNGED